MIRVGGSEFGNDGEAIGLDEGKVFAVRGEAKIGVEFGAGEGAVLGAGEDDEVGPGIEDDVGESPLRGVGGVVGEMVAVEKDDFRSGIVNLDPVGSGAVFIEESTVIDGEEFRDDGFAGKDDADAGDL